MTKRLELDTYFTPEVVADAIIGDLFVNFDPLHRRLTVPLPSGKILDQERPCFRVLEPSVGKGAFVRSVSKLMPDDLPAFFSMVDLKEHPDLEGETFKVLDERSKVIHTSRTFARHAIEDFNDPVGFNLICGNPPFSCAEEHIKICLRQLRHGGVCAMLLRLSILESWERAHGLWKTYPPDEVIVLDGRPSFAHGATDSVGYCVVVWSLPYRRPKKHVTTMRWLRWAATPRRVLSREKKVLPPSSAEGTL